MSAYYLNLNIDVCPCLNWRRLPHCHLPWQLANGKIPQVVLRAAQLQTLKVLFSQNHLNMADIFLLAFIPSLQAQNSKLNFKGRAHLLYKYEKFRCFKVRHPRIFLLQLEASNIQKEYKLIMTLQIFCH